MCLLSFIMKVTFLHFFIFGQELWFIASALPTAVNGNLQPAVPVPEPSYLNVALMALGLSLVLLFIVKWFYQLHRYRRTRITTEDNWLGLSVLQRAISSKSLNFGDEKSGLLVGLFGSPLWETRYSAFRAPENTSSDPAQTALKPGPRRHSGSNFLLRSFGLSNRQPEIFCTGRINKPCTTPGHTSSELLPVLIPAITSNSYPIWNPEIGTEVRAQQSAPSASSTTAPQRLFSSASGDKQWYPIEIFSALSIILNWRISRLLAMKNITLIYLNADLQIHILNLLIFLARLPMEAC
ncbi:hypothetical protein BDN70DRAFT_631791 [Pholiota conissans]|uniref:Uncharacterized protein n=1 Tax=Pholiota conissans TaxID=109636 RepID=A0A9P6D684_9AGAR|nr:hypothetical protein BDN70DRAFT_631791 [Pholiota conissans]